MARAPRAAAAAPPGEPAPAAPPPALSVPVQVLPAPEPASIVDAFDAAFAEAAAAEVEAAAAPKKPVPAPAEPPPAPAEPPPAPAEPQSQPAPAEPPPAPAEPQSQPSPQPPQPMPLPPVSPQPPQPPQPPPQFQPPPPQPRPQAQEPPLFNEEEITQLQTFYTDWPDVARATETMVRGIMTQTARRMYQDLASSLAPYLHTIDTLADRSQLSELQTQVTDYDVVSGQLTSWAARQPAYLRAAYEHVIKAGTAAEVVDLINRYKQDTMPSPSSAAPLSPAAAAPQPAPVNPALAAAAARLAPVATKRTNVVAPPADFDTAFAEFARAS